MKASSAFGRNVLQRHLLPNLLGEFGDDLVQLKLVGHHATSAKLKGLLSFLKCYTARKVKDNKIYSSGCSSKYSTSLL